MKTKAMPKGYKKFEATKADIKADKGKGYPKEGSKKEIAKDIAMMKAPKKGAKK
jgi:hypothetical protein